MKYSVRLSNAVHILAYIDIFQESSLSSETIAKSVKTNPVTVRKIMVDLKSADLIETQNGKAKPRLTKRPEAISLYEIYKSVEKDNPIFHTDKNTAPNCLIGGNIQAVLEATYADLQESIEEKMKSIFLSEIISNLVSRNTEKNVTKSS